LVKKNLFISVIMKDSDEYDKNVNEIENSNIRNQKRIKYLA
jgi:hypothetical protein